MGANQAGIFDVLKTTLPEHLVNGIAWRTNETGRIDPRFLVALSWVTLAMVPTISDYGVSPLSGTTAYSGKAEALKRFTALMQAEGVTRKIDTNASFDVIDTYVESALRMLNQVLECYDIIYEGFQAAYNANNGAFGRISAVKKASKGNTATLFSQEDIPHEVPPLGYVMPVVFSLQALIKVNDERKVLEWIVDPTNFFSNSNNLEQLVGTLKPIIEMVDWDPQQVGKSGASYSSVKEKARNMVLESLLGK